MKRILKILIRALKIGFFGEKEIPSIPLGRENMQNCKLLLNRSELLTRLKKRGKIAEIGVAQGEFSEQILRITEPDSLHLIDVWNSRRDGPGPFEKVTARFREQIDNGRVQIHRKWSIDAAEDFEDNYFDWIYIDTRHSYDTTSQELVKYSSKVKHDGVIAGHDYTMGDWNRLTRYGVIEAVHEFCVKHRWKLVYLTIDTRENQSFAIKRIRK